MTSFSEVQKFLKEFQLRLPKIELLFQDTNGSSSQLLTKLEITYSTRKDIIMSLSPLDFCEGPNADGLLGIAKKFVFGKNIKSKVVKISIGNVNENLACVSIYEAQQPLNYPFK